MTTTPTPRPGSGSRDAAARVRPGDEGRHHQRRRLPARGVRARHVLPPPLGRRVLGRRHRGRRRRVRRDGPGQRRVRALATLPHDLTETVQGQHSRLFTLFEPQPTMRRLFGLATAGLGTPGKPGTGDARRRAPLLAAVRRARRPLGVALIVLGFLQAAGAVGLTGLRAGAGPRGLASGSASASSATYGRIPATGSACARASPLTASPQPGPDRVAARDLPDAGRTDGRGRADHVRRPRPRPGQAPADDHQPLAPPADGAAVGRRRTTPSTRRGFRTLFPEKVVARMEHSTDPATTLTADQWVSDVPDAAAAAAAVPVARRTCRSWSRCG